MPNVLAHVLKGRLAGTFQEMDSEDLATAEKEGWAEALDGRPPTVPTRGDHKKADSYFDKVADERDKRMGVGKYSNRMMQSGGPSEKPKPSPEEPPPTPIIDPAPPPPPPPPPEPEPEPEYDDTTTDGEAPRKRGRPKKY